MQVTVIGAGISGLSAALELRTRGAKVTVIESADRPGGVISTTREGGFLVESGPTSLSSTPGLERLIDQLGLASQQVTPLRSAKRRFIVRGGTLVAVPSSPASLVSTKALSTLAKLRLIREPFIGSPREQEDESVASLVRRRLGDEILTYMVNPFVAGIYAGDPERLSARHALPLLYHAERRHGSLLLGGLREAKARRGVLRVRGITSFRDGLATLPNTMASTLGARVKLRTTVTGLVREGDGWRVQTISDGQPGDHFADAVLYAGPAHALSALGLPTSVRDELVPIGKLPHPPLATLALGFKRSEVTHPLDGFGVLCPAIERRNILGALFSSSIFSGRAPEGEVLITCFVGGSRNPTLGRAELATVLPLVLSDLRALLGVRGEPTMIKHQRWAQAIPQYEVGHGAVQKAAERVESALPGLYLTGQWRAGIALGDCIAQGQAAAERIVAER